MIELIGFLLNFLKQIHNPLSLACNPGTVWVHCEDLLTTLLWKLMQDQKSKTISTQCWLYKIREHGGEESSKPVYSLLANKMLIMDLLKWSQLSGARSALLLIHCVGSHFCQVLCYLWHQVRYYYIGRLDVS